VPSNIDRRKPEIERVLITGRTQVAVRVAIVDEGKPVLTSSLFAVVERATCSLSVFGTITMGGTGTELECAAVAEIRVEGIRPAQNSR